MPNEITDAMVDAAIKESHSKRLNTLTNSEAMRAIITAALAARPAPEVGSVAAMLRERMESIYDYASQGPEWQHDRLCLKAADLIDAQASAIAEREERIERLEKALWPFAEAAKRFGFPLPHPDETFIWAVNGGNPDEPRPRISVGDLVRARAALQQEGE